MAIENIHLRKLLQLLFASENEQKSLVRSEVRQDIAKSLGDSSSGGDFYGPFWSDVKEHVDGREHLSRLSAIRIQKNARRARLYPVLEKGFLKWWDEQRRWTNEPFMIIRTPSTSFVFDESLTIKLDNFLSVRDASGVDRFVYPYFYESPVLKNEAARIGLWVTKNAFKGLPSENFRILDVPRGRIFSPDRCYLEGDEQEILATRFAKLLDLYIEIEETF